MFRLTNSFHRIGNHVKYFKVPPTLYFETRRNFQVAIIGGSNPTAQTLSLLLKEHPSITRLVLFDLPKSTCGAGVDLSHIPSGSQVEGQAYDIECALQGSHIVVIASSEPKRLGQTDYDLFKSNSNNVIQSINEICKYCPHAFILNLTEPINYTTPLVSLVLNTNKAYNKSKVFGVTGRDSLRAEACLQVLYGLPREQRIKVPVICGQSKTTSVPLLSHITPWFNVDNIASVLVTENVRGIETQVIALKGGAGQSSLSSSYAAFNTIAAILKALNGCTVKHIALVANDEYKTKFFASPAVITKEGISAINNYSVLSTLEAAYLQDAIKELGKDVDEAESYYKQLTEKKEFKI